jgi:hypothetical protein
MEEVRVRRVRAAGRSWFRVIRNTKKKKGEQRAQRKGKWKNKRRCKEGPSEGITTRARENFGEE